MQADAIRINRKTNNNISMNEIRDLIGALQDSNNLVMTEIKKLREEISDIDCNGHLVPEILKLSDEIHKAQSKESKKDRSRLIAMSMSVTILTMLSLLNSSGPALMIGLATSAMGAAYAYFKS